MKTTASRPLKPKSALCSTERNLCQHWWGDRIVVMDSPDTAPLPVSQTSFDQVALTNNMLIGDRPDTQEALLGQLAAKTDLYR